MRIAARPEWLNRNAREILLALIVLVGLGVAIALTLIVIDANRARDHAIERRSHSFEVMMLTRSVASGLSAAEAELARYAISGDPRFRARFEREWSTAGAQAGALRRMVGNGAQQRARVERLLRAYADRTGELAGIAARRDQAAAIYREEESDARDRIDRELSGLLIAERALLDDRSVRLSATIARSNRLAAGLLAFGFVLIGVGLGAGLNLVHALAARRVADVAAADQRVRAEELEAAIDTVTRRLVTEQAERAATEAKLAQAQKMEAIGQLTGGIAHDFNNMLSVVLGGIELAGRQIPPGSPAATHLAHAAEGGHRAAALTRQLLAFARVEALAPETIDPAELIDGMTLLLDRTLGDGIRVETLHDHHDWSVRADRHQLENAVLNLAVNARDAMEGRGVLSIETRGVTLAASEVDGCDSGDHVAIVVTDSGHGMTEAVQARVFEPFFTTKPAGKGTGLGLSQVFGTVRQLGGDVTIRSAPGAGTAVTLYLPRDRQAAAATAATDSTSREAMSSPSLDILVVEDDPRVLRSTVAALADLGHRPVACGDPLAAEQAIATMHALDLIVSDVVMPGRTGPEMVSGLRATRPDLRVLFVTGFAGEIGDDTLGGEHVLRKPFTLAALERAVTAAGG